MHQEVQRKKKEEKAKNREERVKQQVSRHKKSTHDRDQEAFAMMEPVRSPLKEAKDERETGSGSISSDSFPRPLEARVDDEAVESSGKAVAMQKEFSILKVVTGDANFEAFYERFLVLKARVDAEVPPIPVYEPEKYFGNKEYKLKMIQVNLDKV